jgi:GNAT superfamily N-acetyltransferase
MDAKKQYEGHHKTDYPITLGMFVDSLHTEYRALGGVTNENVNQLSITIPNEKQSEDLYKMSENEMGYVGAPRLALMDGKTVAGGIFLEQENTFTLDNETITTPLTEYKFDIVIRKKYRGKGYAKLLLDRMLIDFLENFPEAEQIRAELINKKLAQYLVSKYGFTCDSDNDEDITYCYLSRDEALSQVKKRKGKISFADGGYIDEQMFVDQNLKKIDDIYVIDKNGNQQDSLGDFTLQGFGKYMMRDLAKELYDEYKIRLRSDFALMIGEEVINPSIKVVQKTGNHINYLALIYNALVTEEGVVSYVYNEDGEEIGKFTDEDKAQEYVDAYDGVYVEARVEEITQPETILSMQFDFDTHKMKFVSSLLDKHSTHEFKYGGKL